MVIEPGNNLSSTTSSSAGKKSVASPGASSSNQGGATSDKASVDNVSLSVAGQSMAKVEAQLSKTSDVNESKVAEIRQAIADGSYQINSQNIAKQMLSQEDLLG